ncbi:MAG: hypothetical protein M3022_03170 [Actinomycetota bacterium]|nr:hypothetical protein [Actinomycetota bacterium]
MTPEPGHPPRAETPPPIKPLGSSSVALGLLAGGLALVAGVAALVIAILLVRGVLL